MSRTEEIDWEVVQAFYDEGHTRDECRQRFGFSKRSWQWAVDRGAVRPRLPGTQVGPDATRNRVAECLQRGLTYVEAARELGIAKATVAFHARRLGREADARFATRYDWEAVQQAHNAGMRALECCRHFGFSKAAWTAAVARGAIVPRPHVIPLEELLVRGRRTQRGHLKRRLLSAGVKQDRCEVCGAEDWLDMPLNMHLHHINGDGTDNRLANLQFLCPNCHSQTDTYGGRNGHRGSERHLKLVEPAAGDTGEAGTGS